MLPEYISKSSLHLKTALKTKKCHLFLFTIEMLGSGELRDDGLSRNVLLKEQAIELGYANNMFKHISCPESNRLNSFCID